MDQRAAKRLSPCMSDPASFSTSNCKGQAAPVALSFGLWADGEDVTKSIMTPTASAGGEYGGDETFTWEAAFVRLQHGRKYHLSVRVVGDGTILSAAHPRLVVQVATPGFLEMVMLQRLAALAVAIVLILGAIIWAAVGWLKGKATVAV
jgi:hypothetical protein